MRNLFHSIIVLFAVIIVAGCSNEESLMAMSENTQETNTRAVVTTKTPKFTVYIETNDINPLNAGEYIFCNTDPVEHVIDHVILFASNIRGTASSVELYHNPNQTHILNNVETLVRPLQDKGIKVLLGLLGDHTGVGFANLTTARIESFAQQVADCVNTYGLDGVDFDDEYAEYGKISGVPSPSYAAFSALIVRLRQLMPNKLITAFRYGYATGFNQAALNAIDYMWPNFGYGYSAPTGFANNKWANVSVHCTDGYPSCDMLQYYTQNYPYGAIMMFNLREYDCSSTMNCFASNLWGSKTVCHTGTSHSKTYGD